MLTYTLNAANAFWTAIYSHGMWLTRAVASDCVVNGWSIIDPGQFLANVLNQLPEILIKPLSLPSCCQQGRVFYPGEPDLSAGPETLQNSTEMPYVLPYGVIWLNYESYTVGFAYYILPARSCSHLVPCNQPKVNDATSVGAGASS